LKRKKKLNISSRVKSSAALHRAFNVDPLYLQHENAGVAIDYMVLLMIILFKIILFN
jgi:hypothetical protein